VRSVDLLCGVVLFVWSVYGGSRFQRAYLLSCWSGPLVLFVFSVVVLVFVQFFID
jgi:hypothetical protein